MVGSAAEVVWTTGSVPSSRLSSMAGRGAEASFAKRAAGADEPAGPTDRRSLRQRGEVRKERCRLHSREHSLCALRCQQPLQCVRRKYRLQMFKCSLDLTSRRKHQRLTCSALFAFMDCSSHKCETLLVNAAPTKLVRPASSFAICPLAANFCDDLLTTKV